MQSQEELSHWFGVSIGGCIATVVVLGFARDSDGREERKQRSEEMDKVRPEERKRWKGILQKR